MYSLFSLIFFETGNSSLDLFLNNFKFFYNYLANTKNKIIKFKK